MTRMTKKLSLVALTGALISSCVALIAVSADNATYGVSKAEVRVNADGKNGIVYETQYLKSELDGLDIQSTGTLFIPEDLLDEEELSLENELAVKVETTDKWGVKGDYAISRAYLYGIPAYSYNREILARSYVQLTDGYVMYSTEKTASFKEVIDIAKSSNSLTVEQIATVNGYEQAAPKDYSVLDLSSETQASISTVTFGNAEYVETYKGGSDLVKIVFDEENDCLDNSAWKAEFWKSYYEDYSIVTVDVYVENAQYLEELSIVGLGEQGVEHKLYLKSETVNLNDGWNSVIFDISELTDNFDCFKKGIRIFGSLLPEYKDGQGTYSATVYVGSIKVTNLVSVENSSAGILNVDGSFLAEDNSAELFASCTDVQLTVYASYGIVEVTDGVFTPQESGKHTFVYTAKNVKGEPIRASYTLQLRPIDPGMVNEFASSSGWVPQANGGYLPTVDDKNGVIFLTGKSDVNGGPKEQGMFHNGKEFFAYSKTAYEAFDKIVFVLKVVKANENLEVSLRIVNGKDAVGVTDSVIISAVGDMNSEWIEVEFDMKNILEKFDKDQLSNNVKLSLSCKVDPNERQENMAQEDITATVYIDRVYCKNSSEDPVLPDITVDPDLVNDFSNANWTPAVNGGYKASFQGKTGVIYLSGLANADGTVLAKGAFNHGTEFFLQGKSAYEQFNTLVVDCYVEKTNENLIVSLRLDNGAEGVELAPAKIVSSAGDLGGTWLSVEFDMEKTLEKFDMIHDHIKLSILCEVAKDYRTDGMTGGDITAKIYIDKITAKYVEEVILCPGCESAETVHNTCQYCSEYLCVGDHSGCAPVLPEILCPGCESTEQVHAICDVCREYLCVGDHSGCEVEVTGEVLVNDFADRKWVPLANGGYEETFQGKSGVTYISGTATADGKPQGKGAFNNGTDFFVLDKSAYENCDKLIFYVWVEKSNVNLEVALTIDNGADASNLVAQTIISAVGDEGGQWIEVELDIANILKKFDTCHDHIKLVTNCKVDVNHRTDNMSSEETSAKIYIDKVVAVMKSADPV